MATVYLIHFDQPIGNERHRAQHYIGYTKNLKRRLVEHSSGNGSRIVNVVVELGISWQLVKTWTDGTRELERRLKRQKHAWRHCEICRETRRSHDTN